MSVGLVQRFTAHGGWRRKSWARGLGPRARSGVLGWRMAWLVRRTQRGQSTGLRVCGYGSTGARAGSAQLAAQHERNVNGHAETSVRLALALPLTHSSSPYSHSCDSHPHPCSCAPGSCTRHPAPRTPMDGVCPRHGPAIQAKANPSAQGPSFRFRCRHRNIHASARPLALAVEDAEARLCTCTKALPQAKAKAQAHAHAPAIPTPASKAHKDHSRSPRLPRLFTIFTPFSTLLVFLPL